jgi:hypothetical protein
MAIAPLPREQLEARSDYIFTGEVRSAGADAPLDTSAMGDDPDDAVAVLTIEIDGVERSALGSPSGRFDVQYRPGHQHNQPKVGVRVRVFVAIKGDGTAELLEPNGWEPLSS